MGEYTWFVFTAEFNDADPILETMQYMTDPQAASRPRDLLPAAAIFDDDSRYRQMMLMNDACKGFIAGPTTFRWDQETMTYRLGINSAFKHYKNEIIEFLLWLEPHDRADDGFRGFLLSEHQNTPTLIYRERDGYMVSPSYGSVDMRRVTDQMTIGNNGIVRRKEWEGASSTST